MTKALKIVIDARLLNDRLHGIARYLYEIIRHFRDFQLPHKFTLLSNNPIMIKTLELPHNFEIVPVKSKPFEIAEFTEIPFLLKKIEGDLFHAPSISVPIKKIMPTVITVHDLIPYHFGGFVHKTYCKTVLKKALLYSSKIMTDSQFVKNDLVSIFKCPPEKIKVVLCASTPVSHNKASTETLQKKYNIKPPFLFSLLNPRPHKNVKGLIEIYNTLRNKTENDVNLAIGCRKTPEMEALINASPYKNSIVLMDYLEEEELEALYSSCEVFVFPSLYEGFGLPPLEAMQRGSLVVSSNYASLPEVAGDGGILWNPKDIEGFAEQIIKLLNDKKLQEEYREKARKQCQAFSWKTCAQEVLTVYETLYEEKGLL